MEVYQVFKARLIITNVRVTLWQLIILINSERGFQLPCFETLSLYKYNNNLTTTRL